MPGCGIVQPEYDRSSGRKTVEMPEYNFVKGQREYHGDFLTLGPDDVLVIEGIHCLNEKLSYALPRKNKFKIYISALTQLNIDEHNRIPTTDGVCCAALCGMQEPAALLHRTPFVCGRRYAGGKKKIFSRTRRMQM